MLGLKMNGLKKVNRFSLMENLVIFHDFKNYVISCIL